MNDGKKRTIKRVIQRCGCDKILPLTLVYIFYVILHGHLSPGGGFQGGVLMVAVVVLIYLGHGYENTVNAFRPSFLRRFEGFAVTLYIAIAFMGIVFGAQFCSGTIAWMDEAVGLNVLTGVSVLAISMLGLLVGKDIDYKK